MFQLHKSYSPQDDGCWIPGCSLILSFFWQNIKLQTFQSQTTHIALKGLARAGVELCQSELQQGGEVLPYPLRIIMPLLRFIMLFLSLYLKRLSPTLRDTQI